jgi:hypothetical protein
MGEGKAQPLFARVAEPTGGRNAAWQPSARRGQSGGDAVSAAALTGPPTAAQTGIPLRPLVREPLPPATALRQRRTAPAPVAVTVTCSQCLGKTGHTGRSIDVTSVV